MMNRHGWPRLLSGDMGFGFLIGWLIGGLASGALIAILGYTCTR